MATIIFTAGAKGGTGKSTAIRLLITYLREHGFSPSLLDMDDESRTLSRFFPDALQIETKNTSEPFSHDLLVEKALSGENLVVADLKGGTGKETLEWWERLPFEELPDIKFICLASITSTPDSVRSFLAWVAALQGKVSYIVCQNQKDGAAFPDYEETREAAEFRKNFNPIHVHIRRLNEIYMTELERLNLNISEVLEANGNLTINGKEVGSLLSKILKRAHLRGFQCEIYQQFEPVLSLLNV